MWLIKYAIPLFWNNIYNTKDILTPRMFFWFAIVYIVTIMREYLYCVHRSKMLVPRVGEIYRHYKSTWWDHHTYEIVWIAKHSETEEELVIYKPLFDGEQTWLGDSQYAARPVRMWFDTIERKWKTTPRFSLIIPTI